MKRDKSPELEQGVGYVPLVTPAAPAKVGTHKVASNLSRQLTAYEYPGDKQGSIFDELQPKTREEILKGQAAETIAVGLGDCSSAERKLIDALCMLLGQKSQTKEPGADGYYLGNIPKNDRRMVAYGSLGQIEAPSLVVSLYEITKLYSQGEGIGGKDQSNVLDVLRGLAEKKFLIRYTRTTRIPGAKGNQPAKVENTIEQFGPIIHLITEEQRTYTEDDQLLETTGKQLKVVLSPLFRDQIDSQFVLRPNDIIQRTALAYGSQHIPEATLRLRDWLLHQIGHKNSEVAITQKKALYRVAEKSMRQHKRKRAQEQLDTALETAKKLGLLLSWELTPSEASSEMIYRLFLNLDFQ